MGVGVVNHSGGHGWGVVGGVADRRPPEKFRDILSYNNELQQFFSLEE